MTTTQTATVNLKKGRARPFWYRHPWVYSGAIHRVDGKPENGDVVDLIDSSGRFVGRGFYNGGSQIRVRVCTWESGEAIDEDFFVRRLAAAVELRRTIGLPAADTDGYRVVHAEGDGLPGLIVDRFGPVLSVQLSVLGLARWREVILDALRSLPGIETIVERAADYSFEDACGVPSDPATQGEVLAEFRESGLVHRADIASGQKSGFYFDQRDNRRLFGELVRGRRVLDGYCYTGGFALAAKRGGADEVLAIDSSRPALERAVETAAANDIDGIRFESGDVHEVLRDLSRRGDRFGAVNIDPPKFCPTRNDLARAANKYRELNRLAIRAVEPGGILATSSCSGHLHADHFVELLNEAAKGEERAVRILYRRGQGADHPVATSCPESEYLKFVVCRVE